MEPALLEFPTSQLCTHSQFEEPIYSKLCEELYEKPRFHRKQWEFAYILQVLKIHNKLSPGAKGLGFGCGKEPLPAIFAKYDCKITATDLAEKDSAGKGWKETAQHTGNLDQLFEASKRIVDHNTFYRNISYKEVDMNSIPEEFENAFDFVWSACSLEHLGSLQAGIDFLYSSLRCLKKGGIGVHTTEFNVSSNEDTLENNQVCLYRKKDIINLMMNLPDNVGYAKLNFNPGDRELDSYVDLPPYLSTPHLKLLVQNYITTSIGLIFIKK